MVQVRQDDVQNSAFTDSSTELRAEFIHVAEYAAETNNPVLLSAAALMADLLSVAALFADDPSLQDRSSEIRDFSRNRVLPLLADERTFSEQGERVIKHVHESWGELLSLLAPEEKYSMPSDDTWHERQVGNWGNPTSVTEADLQEEDPGLPSAVDLSVLLASLEQCSDLNAPASEMPASKRSSTSTNHSPGIQQRNQQTSDRFESENPARKDLSTPDLNPGNPGQVATGRDSGSAQEKISSATVTRNLPRPPSGVESINDPDMVAAYADDAQQCLAEMEASLLSLESGHPGEEALRNFCRQLHTLKGASGTVGLSKMALYLHELESWIESAPACDVSVDSLLECVDTVRTQLGASESSGIVAVPPITPPLTVPISGDQGDVQRSLSTSAAARNTFVSSSTVPASVVAAGGDGDGFVRVDASQLERLMDLLAELVMLRNHRDSHVEALRTVHDELNLCALRARTLTNTIDLVDHDAAGVQAKPVTAPRKQAAHARLLARSLNEIAHDTAELSRSLQEIFEPLSQDNSAVTHLIGQFRQELMELRRVPVGGLFQRLQRSIRDAARAEGKRVEICVEGQGARAERAIQQRLFEPLLHLVRNAVSHGIQLPEDRECDGKSPVGRITLSAWSGAAALCIEVRDDGRGLDEEALEVRGRQLGLLMPGETVTPAQLRQLIFHPGFSTKTSVSEISGRGVGMDVVDNWVRRLRGRIDVESVAGRGTTFRLQIPLRSAVEHAMLVRVGTQQFALPMHTVSGTSDAGNPVGGSLVQNPRQKIMALSDLLNLNSSPSERGCLIKLRSNQKQSGTTRKSTDSCVTVCVDAIVGVEEVVVRSLPPLLQRNELFAGVTLSGRADIVLLLDAERLIELHKRSHCEPSVNTITSSAQSANDGQPKDQAADLNHRNSILIVDDSVVVRRNLAKKLMAEGIATQEAENGHTALKVLRNGQIVGVVTDIDMPGMNGVELLQEMKRQKQYRAIPVIVLSSRDEESMPKEVHGFKPVAILAKPVTNETVNRIVQAFGPVLASRSSPVNSGSKLPYQG